MTREEAKEILQLYRPGGPDDDAPFFAEALARVSVDPVLAEWFAEQQAFDQSISGALNQIPVPINPRVERLKNRAASRWWNRSLRPLEFAAAASLALLLAVGGMRVHERSSDFSYLRDQVLKQSWAGKRHVDLETSNLAEIRRFIVANDLQGDFKLPPELASMRPHGCKVLTVKDQKVSSICFIDGSKHLHLVVMNRAVSPEPTLVEVPEFASWNNWATATWSNGDTTYVLMGLRPNEFVKKFRKERQWDLGG